MLYYLKCPGSMINAFILLLPASVCLFWLLLYPLTISKAGTFKSLMFLTGAICLFLLADSCYASPLSTPHTLRITSLITQLAGPSLIPLILIYMQRIGKDSQLKHIHLIWIFIPIILFTGELIMDIVYGEENIEHYLADFYANGIDIADKNSGYVYHNYYLWAVVGFRIVMAIEVLILLMNFLLLLRHRGLPLRYLPAFLYRKGNIQVLGLSYASLAVLFLLSLVKMAFLRNFLLKHQWFPLTIAILATIVLFFFNYFGLFSARKTISLEHMKNAFSYDDPPEYKNAVNTKSPASDILSMSLVQNTGNKENNILLTKFQRIVIGQQMFLQPQLTVTDIADKLGTNKTYISKLVNSAYQMPFPDFINSLRVDYAQRYIINHRNATQAEVAKACGFTSASALNNTFKKVTGMTPKIWLATHDKKHYS